MHDQPWQHLSAEELSPDNLFPRHEVKRPRGSRPSMSSRSLCPFRLVSCSSFTKDRPAPFRVVAYSNALLIIDMHAHASHTEVIGLLGGKFLTEEGILEVCAAVPCAGVSTDLQCEVDPVSLTHAAEQLGACGLVPIGWYHSHPAFPPSPSLRDIDTQSKYQNYFARGGAQFVGMIISPFNRGKSAHSQFSCVTISEERSPCGEFRLPYALQLEIKLTASSMDDLLSTARIIASKYEPLRSGTRMLQPCITFPSLTYLQKMLLSMKITLLSCTVPSDNTVSRLSKGSMGEQCDPTKGTRNMEAMNGRVGGMDATEGCVPFRDEQNAVFLCGSEDQQHSGNVSNCKKAQAVDETRTDVDVLLCEVEKIFTVVYTAAKSGKAG